MRTDFYYPSCGAGSIHGCRWEPAGAPVAVLQIVHGLGGHSARYDHFARFMASQGFLVVAGDHMGHGGSVSEETPSGHFEGGWFKAVGDVHRLLKTTRLEYPDIPYILLGQSMGSFMVRTLLAQYPKCGVSAAILCGTGWMHRGILNSGIAAATLMGKMQGFQKPSAKLTESVFSGYNRRIEHQRTDFDWLSRSSRVVDAYLSDPNCFHAVTPGLVRDLLTGMKYNQEPENLSRMRKDLPVFVISGGDDPVGGYGEGVKKTVQAFTGVGMENVSMRLYPLCRHELLNELNREEVYNHILTWIQKQVSE